MKADETKIARVDGAGRIQPLEEHLRHTAEFCGAFLAPCGFGDTGRLLGLLHDLGKYSQEFQNYIRSVTGLLKEGDPGFVPDAKRGSISHAKTGVLYLEYCIRETHTTAIPQDPWALLAMPILCHHASPADVYAPDGTPFWGKISTKGQDSPELFGRIAPEIGGAVRELVRSGSFSGEIGRFARTDAPDNFDLGLLLRLLYSALIDADRTDAAGRTPETFRDWPELVDRLERYLAKFAADTELNRIRKDISDVLRGAAGRPRGVYRLTIPTGGGKTLAGLRFALRHAAAHGMKKVIYAAPFLSILEQNARVFRESLDDLQGEYVLECHSNVLREMDSGETPRDALAETWEAPVICTTMVQILNAMFSGESRYARRFHQFADAVILLDEIQSLPMEMFHIFNRTVNFIAERMHATVILCSATQPELASVNKEKGCIRYSESPELYPGYRELFRKLRRVKTEYVPGTRTDEDVAAFADRVFAKENSLLLICNTKRHAAAMFRLLRDRHPEAAVFHLSTNLCAAHRRDTLDRIRKALAEHVRLIVVSTSLIEAGVDISFSAVIRMMTSLDSIVQAAGRCNRNAEAAEGKVYILDNPLDNLGDDSRKLPLSVKTWSASTGKALRDYTADPERFDGDILSPALLKDYYTDLYARGKNRDLMVYPVSLPECTGETLLNLLGLNKHSYQAYQRWLTDRRYEAERAKLAARWRWLEEHCQRPRGAFHTAGEKFKALDDLADIAVVVPYGEGDQLIKALCALPPAEEMNKLLKQAQMFTVNITENNARKLHETGAIYELSISGGSRAVWIAQGTSYSADLGLSDGVGHLDTALCEGG